MRRYRVSISRYLDICVLPPRVHQRITLVGRATHGCMYSSGHVGCLGMSMVMVEELYIFYIHAYHGTCLYVHGRSIKPIISVVMVSFLAGTISVDMRNIMIYTS